MIQKGNVRKFFPGANSAYGFYSLYGQLSRPSAQKVFIIKGGPGTGKSTLLKKIGEAMRCEGLNVEYHYCSADPRSLDGVVIPAVKTVLLDGTSPHTVDPRYPGAVEEIVNLGAFWNEKYLIRHKEKIRSLVDNISSSYQRAYIYLAAAKSYRDAAENYYRNHNHGYITSLDSLALDLLEEILGGRNRIPNGAGQRKLFASAITSRGTINHLENLISSFSLVFLLYGDDGGSKRKIINGIADAALVRGFDVEIFCCALDPLQFDHLFIPELKVALVNSMEPHAPRLNCYYRVIDTNHYAVKLPIKVNEEKEGFYRNYRHALKKAITFLEKARQQHEDLEQYYIPAMNFNKLDIMGKELLEKVQCLIPDTA